MKNKITLVFLISFMIIFLGTAFYTSASTFPVISALQSNSNLLKLNLTTAYSVKVVQVSFDGNDGDKGFLQVKNSEGIVVRQIEEVELIKSPSYFTIDVSAYKTGDYTFSIKTAKNSYSSIITIK